MEDLTVENCRKKFLSLRKSTLKKIESADFEDKDDATIDAYNDICIKAVEDDPVAQDYLSYIFKKGLTDIIPVNYEKFMQWEILAGANGNQFSLDKLSLFLNYALNEVVLAEDFSFIADRNGIDETNILYIIGRLICEAIADELNLKAVELIKETVSHVAFSAPMMRVFDRARNFAIPKVLKFLRS